MTSHRWHHPSDACFRGAVQPGIAIVTACRDRLDHLQRSMETWLACAEVTEIVVVDWSSADPIIEPLKGDVR